MNWEDFGIYAPHELPGHWLHVVTLDKPMGYDWRTLHAFLDPKTGRYFWHGDSGCSCNEWGDRLCTEANFQNGSRDDLIRAMREFADFHEIQPSALLSAVQSLYCSQRGAER